MLTIFQKNLDYLFFVYGLSFIILAGICFMILRRKGASVLWWWLGAFGLVHGVSEWLDLVAVSFGDNPVFYTARVAVLALSLFFLAECGRAGCRIAPATAPGGWIYVPVVFVIVLMYMRGGPQWADIAARYLLGVCGGLLASRAVYLFGTESDARAMARRYALIAGGCIGMYALTQAITPAGPFFPAYILNTENFSRFFSFPVQIVRTALVIVLAFLLWTYWYCKECFFEERLGAKIARRVGVVGGMVTACFVAAFFIINWMGEYRDTEGRDDLLVVTKAAAAAVDPARIKSLSGSPRDIGTPDYTRLKEQLTAIRGINAQYRFAYVMGRRGGKVFFFVDSEPEASPDYSPPGSVYDEASPEVSGVFVTGKTLVEGPLTDKWGSWVSAFAPIRDLKTGKLVAVLGMDISWRKLSSRIALSRFLGICVSFIGFIVLFNFFIIGDLRKFTLAKISFSEAMLRESEAKYRTVVENMQDVFYRADIAGNIIMASPSAARVLGYNSTEEIIGKNLEKELYYDPGDRGRFLAALQKEGVLNNYEVTLKRSDGAPVFVSANSHLYRDAGGRIIGVEGTFRDITARKQAVDALKDSSVKYKTLFDSSADAIMILKPGKRFIDANPAALRLFGCTHDELLKLSPADLSPTYQPDGVLSKDMEDEAVSAALERGVLSFEWKQKRFNGEEFLATVLLTRMDIKGERMLQATVRDITASRQAAEKIANAAKEWATTFDSMAEGVSIHGADLGIINVNAALCELLGKSRQDLIGKKCYDIFHGKDNIAGGCPLERARMTGKEEHVERFEPFLGRWLRISVSPAFNEKGGVINFVHVVSDITDRKKAEADLAAAVEVKAQFVSMVSHELRTPLAAITGSIGTVLDGLTGEINDEQRDFLDTAKRNVDRLTRLINDVLDYQKLEAGRTVFRMQKTDLGKMVKDVLEIMAPVAAARHLSLEAKMAPDLPEVIIDKDKITQVLINLVNNAIKFTDTGGIVITVRRDGGLLVFSVKDTGIGIKKDDMPKLFQGFSQLGSGSARKTGGTGLGLVISKKIVQEHKGDMWVESEYGHGSDFKFNIPIKLAFKALVIDDDKDLLSLCKNALMSDGYEVTVSENGLEALALIQAHKPDIVISDMRLGDMNGFEIIGRLRGSKETAMIPILIISGYPDELAKLESKKSDVALLSLAKPFDMKDLLAMTRSLIRHDA